MSRVVVLLDLPRFIFNLLEFVKKTGESHVVLPSTCRLLQFSGILKRGCLHRLIAKKDYPIIRPNRSGLTLSLLGSCGSQIRMLTVIISTIIFLLGVPPYGISVCSAEIHTSLV